MIKGRGVMFLDGDFKKEHPKPAVHSSRNDKGKWSVTKCGPSYVNVYEITEYDAEGEKWLHAHAEEVGDTLAMQRPSAQEDSE